ncbi:protein THYLAKOID FORMATION1, chloroplastic [Rhododendron vialii]|uniref:protein THYLAKOID FORMATION1, chloroplastic n=1 Tax=Rhododendron vialii TaxID=182163 RepID=UPI00265F1758|nr:protein THYLAKOID FORMATION1, chloroplastic [Rhododendron vialii]
MAAVSSLAFSALGQSTERKVTAPSPRPNFDGIRCRTSFSFTSLRVRVSKISIRCMSSFTDVPTVAETKSNFLNAYKRPIPSIYNTVLQELIVQHHLMRYKRTHRYDAVFALGFVTVFDQLMDGYPSDEDREAIFQSYIRALKEDPDIYRNDAKKLEEWASAQNASSLVSFSSREGEVEGMLKDIAERARSDGSFSYSRFFAIGLFRLLELSNATEPTVLEQLCAALNINKRSVDRDLDVYRNLLSKLVQAKELLKEYVDREKKKREERVESQKASEAVAKCLGDYQYAGR